MKLSVRLHENMRIIPSTSIQPNHHANNRHPKEPEVGAISLKFLFSCSHSMLKITTSGSSCYQCPLIQLRQDPSKWIVQEELEDCKFAYVALVMIILVRNVRGVSWWFMVLDSPLKFWSLLRSSRFFFVPSLFFFLIFVLLW